MHKNFRTNNLHPHLVQIFLYQHDDLKICPLPEGHLIVDLFFTPVLELQGVAYDVVLLKAWVQVERNVCSGLRTTATREVHLKPAKKPTSC